MCYGEGALPPQPPGTPAGPAVAGPLRLAASDGNRFLAYQAAPAGGVRAGVVVLPDFRGLHDFYRELARRFAERGIAAVAIDYYGRTAPDDTRNGSFDGFAQAGLVRPAQAAADVRAAVDHLASGELGEVPALFTVGFCLGGAMSWGQSARDDRLAGAIGLYGRPSECRHLIGRMRAPLLVLSAGADVLTPVDEARGFDRELTEAGVPHRFVLYHGAPHGFFDAGLTEHARAAGDAWRQMLDFIAEHSRATPPATATPPAATGRAS